MRVTVGPSPGHHGELVRAGGGGVVQMIGGRSGLERPVLSLVRGVGRVRWRQVGVVPSGLGGRHGGGHGDADSAVRDRVVCWSVSECGSCRRVVHPSVGETGFRQGGEGTERPFQSHPRITKGREVRTYVKKQQQRSLIGLSSFKLRRLDEALPESLEESSPREERAGESGPAV